MLGFPIDELEWALAESVREEEERKTREEREWRLLEKKSQEMMYTFLLYKVLSRRIILTPAYLFNLS